MSTTSAQSRLTEPPTDLSDQLLAALTQYWGYDDFRPLQSEAMTHVMQDRDSLVVLPTGGGKSLCYQVPAVCRDGLALVVSPLISLMKDQVDSLQAVGVSAACIHSAQTAQEKAKVADLIARRELKLLYIAPERLVQSKTIEFLQSSSVSFVAIDEAHCISQWGHDFRPEYRELRTLKSKFPGVSVHGYTATATEQVRADIVEQLGLDRAELLIGSFDRPNLLYRVERRTDAMPQIQRILDRHKGESGIVYCISRRNVETTCEALCAMGYRAKAYHAGMSDEDRHRNQDFFIEEDDGIIVATVAFGMGIDKSNVRFVIHAEMPKSLEHYQQESGRAGRDGLEAECCLLYSAKDIQTWQFLMKDTIDPDVREQAEVSLNSMKRFCVDTKCRHRQLVEHFGQSFAKDRCGACDVCLQELEPVADSLIVAQKILSGVIRQGERFGAAYTAQVLRGSRAKKIVENRHDQLSTFGILQQESEPQIRGWIDQLLSQGFLVSSGEYNCLSVSPAGRQMLKGAITPQLVRTPGAEMAKQTLEDAWVGVNRELFEQLRGIRTRLAVERSVPPYVIFSDATLRELARVRPTQVTRLTSIAGIGDRKQREFGSELVATIADWCRRHQVSTDLGDGTRRTIPTGNKPRGVSQVRAEGYYELFDKRLSMETVASRLEKSVDTVSRYLGNFLTEHHMTDIDPWVPPSDQQRANKVFGELGTERLKPVFDALNGEVSYAHLRIVATAWQIRHEHG